MAVSDFALDSDGDLEIGAGGETRLAVGAEAIALDWAGRMTLFKGEWQFDRRVGTDFQNQIFDTRPGETLLRHIFETITRETPGVDSLDRLEFEFNSATRELTVTAEVTTDAGETKVLEFDDVLFADAEST